MDRLCSSGILWGMRYKVESGRVIRRLPKWLFNPWLVLSWASCRAHQSVLRMFMPWRRADQTAAAIFSLDFRSGPCLLLLPHGDSVAARAAVESLHLLPHMELQWEGQQ